MCSSDLLCLTIFFAGWLASYRSRNTAEYLGEADRLDGDPSRFVPLIGAWLITSVVVIFQSNLSAAFVLVAIFLSMWWVAVGRPIDLAFFVAAVVGSILRSEEHTSELQSLVNLVCRPLLEKKKTDRNIYPLLINPLRSFYVY